MSLQTNVKTTEGSQLYQDTFSLGKFARRNGTQLGILGVFIALWIFFIVMAPETFLRSQIYFAFMSTIPFFAMVAMPLTMIVIAGEMDLSFPSIMAMGMITFMMTYDVTTSVWLAFLVALGTGVFIGWLNGILP
jgi:simple sugar transport system permease protein